MKIPKLKKAPPPKSIGRRKNQAARAKSKKRKKIIVPITYPLTKCSGSICSHTGWTNKPGQFPRLGYCGSHHTPSRKSAYPMDLSLQAPSSINDRYYICCCVLLFTLRNHLLSFPRKTCGYFVSQRPRNCAPLWYPELRNTLRQPPASGGFSLWSHVLSRSPC